jgi:hypothetical protein
LWQRRLRILTAILAGTMSLLAQDMVGPPRQRLVVSRKPEPKKADAPIVPPRALPVSDDGVRLALADAETLSFDERFFTRWLWIPEHGGLVDFAKDRRIMRLSSLALGYVSRGSSPQLPYPVAGGILLRVDLRRWWPQIKDLKEILALWEEFAFDPAFSLLLTKDTIAFSGILISELPKRKIRRTVTRKRPGWTKTYRTINHPGGRLIVNDDFSTDHGQREAGSWKVPLYWKSGDVQEIVEEEVAALSGDVDVVRLNAPHINPIVFERLQKHTSSLAPVVSWHYFVSRALTSIKDKGVYKTIWGGLYYDLRGIKKARDVLGKDTKATDLDLFLQELGIGNIRGGETFKTLFNRLRSDQRAALFKSRVTGKPRGILGFNTPAGQEGSTFGAITYDVRDQDVDLGSRAYLNLLDPQAKAHEVIFGTRWGLLIFALFNGDGALQDEVPPDIAIDYTIPNGNTKRLQILGCIACHSTDGRDGWQPFSNDVLRLLRGRLAPDVFDDFVRGRDVKIRDPFRVSDTLDRLAGLYRGNMDKSLRRARDDLAEGTLRVTGPWEGVDQTDICKQAATFLFDSYRDIWWNTVSARDALRHLGLETDPRESEKLYKLLLPPDVRAFVGGLNVAPEDARIAAPGQGLGVPWTDFALSWSFSQSRIQKNPLWVKLRERKTR